MTIHHRKLAILGLLAMLAIILMPSSCAGGTAGTGTLEGQVTIGPLQPVERPGVNPPIPAEVFTSRKILVYDESGKNLIKEVSIEQIAQTNKGFYRAELPAGKYLVDINHTGIDVSSDVPRLIEINPDHTVTLNVDIDTGIR